MRNMIKVHNFHKNTRYNAQVTHVGECIGKPRAPSDVYLVLTYVSDPRFSTSYKNIFLFIADFS